MSTGTSRVPVQEEGILLEGLEEQTEQECQRPDQSHCRSSYLTRRMNSLRQQVEETAIWIL
jgi:hypothetical protein